MTQGVPRTQSQRSPTRGFRADVQALRALAIGVVVLNHLWPTRFTGGYVGVDVFFVISGFLITGHLFGEISREGRVRLGAFYARRIRRLLPAALLVLAVAAILAWLYLPYPRWERNAAEIAASAGYVENWLLAVLSVNYSALNDSASVAQHYWSLSVEEQFYLVWPVLITAAIVAFRARRRAVPERRVVGGLLGVILTLSLAASVWFTFTAPSPAYFVTFTRAWEFAVGGLLALLAARMPLSRSAANMIALAGFGAIAVSVLWFGPTTPFPGVAALLPVLGTAAVIVAGTGRTGLWHSWITDRSPVQWLGGASYSLYLWHWPLIVVAPFVLRHELTGPIRVVVLTVALVLAAGTKRFVEDPARAWSFWRSSTRRSLVLMAAGMAAVIALSGGLYMAFASRDAADSPTASVAAGHCVGPAAAAPGSSCLNRYGATSDPVMTKKNEYFFVPSACGAPRAQTPQGVVLTSEVCDFSRGVKNPHDVWLVGDSHAQQWQGAVFALAEQRGWRVTWSYLGGCPAADVAYVGFRVPAAPADASACRQWARAVSTAIQAAHPDVVFTSMAARHDLVDDGTGRPASDQFVDGLLKDWVTWADEGIHVVGIADPPFNGEVRSADCVTLNASDPLICARPRTEAQPPDPIVLAVHRAHRDNIGLIDLTDFFCDPATCYSVVGGIPVYYDADHLNLQYVRMLVPWFARHFDATHAFTG